MRGGVGGERPSRQVHELAQTVPRNDRGHEGRSHHQEINMGREYILEKGGKAGLLAQPATIYRNEALHCNRALVRHPYGGAWRRADPGPRWDSVCRDDAAHQAARVPEDPPSHRLVVKPEGGPRTWRAGQWEEVPPPPALSREGARSFGCAWENLHSWRLQRPWSRNSQQMPGGRPR